ARHLLLAWPPTVGQPMGCKPQVRSTLVSFTADHFEPLAVFIRSLWSGMNHWHPQEIVRAKSHKFRCRSLASCGRSVFPTPATPAAGALACHQWIKPHTSVVSARHTRTSPKMPVACFSGRAVFGGPRSQAL